MEEVISVCQKTFKFHQHQNCQILSWSVFCKVVKFQMFEHLGCVLPPLAHFLRLSARSGAKENVTCALFFFSLRLLHRFFLVWAGMCWWFCVCHGWLGLHVVQFWTTTHLDFCDAAMGRLERWTYIFYFLGAIPPNSACRQHSTTSEQLLKMIRQIF